jgi:hypothetical protein
VVAAQAERFRRRLGYWTARVNELEPGDAPNADGAGPTGT